MKHGHEWLRNTRCGWGWRMLTASFSQPNDRPSLTSRTRLKFYAGPGTRMAAKYVPGELYFFRQGFHSQYEFLVRVLYMVQNNPQYMLARSPTSVPVFMVYNAPCPGSAPSIYGKTRLETCVNAINRSRYGIHVIAGFFMLRVGLGNYSPEFFSEEEEDYSVYLVDPVETQQSGSAFNNASSSSGVLPQFTGVTVGLGVLSSLLDSSSEDVWVAGTISTGPDGSESLEVVFTLKPVCGLPRGVWRD
jgi:hypothetical protein